MVSPVIGCVTGAQNSSHSCGLACNVVRGVRGWMSRLPRAACEYSRGESKAIHGDRRAGVGVCLVGSSVGGMVGCHVGVSVGTGIAGADGDG